MTLAPERWEANRHPRERRRRGGDPTARTTRSLRRGGRHAERSLATRMVVSPGPARVGDRRGRARCSDRTTSRPSSLVCRGSRRWSSRTSLRPTVRTSRRRWGHFLLAWLSEIDCPVANRPRPNCLCGPFWRHERWVLEAARIGLDVEPVLRRANADGGEYVSRDSRATRPASRSSASVASATSTANSARHALRLARATGVETLTAQFADSGAGMRFFTANPWPRLEDDEAATALLDHLVAPAGVP